MDSRMKTNPRFQQSLRLIGALCLALGTILGAVGGMGLPFILMGAFAATCLMASWEKHRKSLRQSSEASHLTPARPE
jgi:hypothetical protein